MADLGKKISELQETTDLAGLYTIGTDKNQQSKKVSLQFLKEAADFANAQGDYAKEVGDTVAGNVGVNAYPTFSASTQYAAGSVVNYNGKLYRFTSLHPAGAWVGTDAVLTSIKAEADLKLTELESEADGIKKAVQVEISSEPSARIETGYYITTSGQPTVLSAYKVHYIALTQGQTISFKAIATNAVGVIAEYVNGNYIVKAVGNADFAEHSYTYKATKDITIAISAYGDSAKDWLITSTGLVMDIAKNASLIDELTIRATSVNGQRYVPEVGQDGYYINSAGSVLSYSSYDISKPISLKKGQILQASLRGGDVVAVIAKVNADGTYQPIHIGEDVTKAQMYEYFAEDDIVVVLSSIGLSAITISETYPLQKYLDSSYNVATYREEITTSSKVLTIPSVDSDCEMRLKAFSNNGGSFSVAINGKIYKDEEKGIELSYFVSANEPSVIAFSNITNGLSYEIEVRRVQGKKLPKSVYEGRLAEYEEMTMPSVAIPSVEYEDIFITSQEEYDSINSAIQSKLSAGVKNLNIVFKDGTFFFNDKNVINLSSISDSDVNIRMECDNAEIMSDGFHFTKSARKGVEGGRGVFPCANNFNLNDVVVVDGSHIYADEILTQFVGDVVSHSASENIYKAVVKDALPADVVGKRVIFTAWWAQVIATITEYNSASQMLYFKTSSAISYINGDRSYGHNAIVKIVNVKTTRSIGYVLEDGNLLLPKFNKDAHICKYPTFLDVQGCSLGSLVLANMRFIGASVSSVGLINVVNSKNVYVVDCEFANIGSSAIRLVNTDSSLVEGCRFEKCSAPITARGNECVIRHNTFYKNGIYYWEAGRAIYFTGGRDFYIGHNRIVDYTYNAIQVYGSYGEFPADWRGVIEYNVVESREWYSDYKEHQLIDSGAIQISVVNFPIAIRHNVICNYQTRASGRGIMMGGNCSRVGIYKNIIVNTPTFLSIDFYKGSEANSTYPNGVENVVMYNIVTSPIQMIGGDDFSKYDNYTKADNDCCMGVNIVGNHGFAISHQNMIGNTESIPYIESQAIDKSMRVVDSEHIEVAYDVQNWKLSDFILSRLMTSHKNL